MFHLPTPDRRSELMIIYGQALPEGSSVSVPNDGADLSKQSPAEAQKILETMKRDLRIQQTQPK
jgi:hypothetical protein